MISPAWRAAAALTSTISWPAPAQPSRRDAEVGGGDGVDGLRLGGHDALEARVAGLDDAGGDAHDGGQRAVDLVVAGLGLALTLSVPPSTSMCLAKRDRRQAEHLGDLLGDGARVAVARLGGGDDEVGTPGRLMAAASTLAVSSASGPASASDR